jgi:hypothetical protein
MAAMLPTNNMGVSRGCSGPLWTLSTALDGGQRPGFAPSAGPGNVVTQILSKFAKAKKFSYKVNTVLVKVNYGSVLEMYSVLNTTIL